MVPTKQRSWGRRVCVIREDMTNQQDPAAKREQAERVARGEGAGAISTSESPGLASPGTLGRGAAGRDQGSLVPLPPLADEETDSAAVIALLGVRGRFVQNEGGRGRIPAWRMLLPHLSQAACDCGQNASLGTRHLGPDSDSATHRVTLDKCCPPWGPPAPPL